MVRELRDPEICNIPDDFVVNETIPMNDLVSQSNYGAQLWNKVIHCIVFIRRLVQCFASDDQVPLHQDPQCTIGKVFAETLTIEEWARITQSME